MDTLDRTSFSQNFDFYSWSNDWKGSNLSNLTMVLRMSREFLATLNLWAKCIACGCAAFISLNSSADVRVWGFGFTDLGSERSWTIIELKNWIETSKCVFGLTWVLSWIGFNSTQQRYVFFLFSSEQKHRMLLSFFGVSATGLELEWSVFPFSCLVLGLPTGVSVP